MKNFSWTTMGIGKTNIILLNGWAINSKIWFFIIQETQLFFKFYLIDLPGCGQNKKMLPMEIDKVIQILYDKMPKNAIWLGWSIGGLIASRFALSYPEHTLAVISVASSPCFIEKKNWPGIKKHTIYRFYNDLRVDYFTTINNFLCLQQKNSQEYFQNLYELKKIICAQSKPNLAFLKNGLAIICLMDLRLEIASMKVPLLRIYGSIDSLVPKKIINILNKKWPNTYSVIIEKSGHAPFISHQKEFCSILLKFKNLFENFNI